MSETEKAVESLKARLVELTTALENCPARKCGTRWWLDRLEWVGEIRRQIERIERAPAQ